MITLSTRFYGLRMNLRSAKRDRNHETRRSEAQPLWTTYSKGCGRRRGEGVQDRFVTTDLDTLATALYVRTDDLLKESPHRAPWRPAAGIGPQVSDAELVTLAVMQALLGFTSEARWLRHVRAHLRGIFPRVPQQPGYNKRLRALAAAMTWLTAVLARDTSLWSDDVWIADSTAVECGRSRETARRSDLAGWAEYGYCASHSRYFWGLRLHLLTTLHGLPIGFALTGAKADERQILLGILDDPALTAGRAGQSSSRIRTTTAGTFRFVHDHGQGTSGVTPPHDTPRSSENQANTASQVRQPVRAAEQVPEAWRQLPEESHRPADDVQFVGSEIARSNRHRNLVHMRSNLDLATMSRSSRGLSTYRLRSRERVRCVPRWAVGHRDSRLLGVRPRCALTCGGAGRGRPWHSFPS